MRLKGRVPSKATEPLLFIAVGGFQFVLDSGLFVTLTWLGMLPSIANVLARLSAACVGFWLNGKLTFGQRALTRRQLGCYAICWVLLTVASTSFVAGAAALAGLKWAWLTKVVVEVVLAATSFVLMKNWVFRQGASP